MRLLQRSAPLLESAAAPWRTAGWAVALGLVLAVVLFAPAAWLARVVESGTDGRVLLAQAEGSVWRGSAQLLLTGGAAAQDATSLPDRIYWKLRPSWTGANLQIDLPCCSRQTAQIGLRLGWAQIHADVGAMRIDLPAQWLVGLGAPWNTLHPQGQMALIVPGLQIQWLAERVRMQGQVSLDLLGMSSRLSTLSPIGDYRLTLVGGDVPRINLQTLQGALQLSGSGQWVGSRMRFSGEATAAEQHLDALGNVLNIIGRRQGAKSLISLG
jgi:general secretion pathway protein N